MIGLIGVIVSIAVFDISLSANNMLALGALLAAIPRKRHYSLPVIAGIGILTVRITLTLLAALLLHLPWIDVDGQYKWLITKRSKLACLNHSLVLWYNTISSSYEEYSI